MRYSYSSYRATRLEQSHRLRAINGYGGPRSSSSWDLTGNAGTTPGANFLGTTDNQPLELKVNSQRALRLEPHATSPNVVGGHSSNTVLSQQNADPALRLAALEESLSQ